MPVAAVTGVHVNDDSTDGEGAGAGGMIVEVFETPR